MSTEDIIEAIKGDEAAFKRVYHEYQPLILAKIKCYCRNSSDCADISQETWTRIIDYWSRTKKSPVHPKAWLGTVALNVCFDHLRKSHKRTQTISSRDMEEIISEIDQKEDWINSEDVKEVILNQLDGRETQVLLSKYCVGKTYAQIADDLNMTRDQIKYILQQTWRKIKERLK